MRTSLCLLSTTTWLQQPRHAQHQPFPIQFGTMGSSYAHAHPLVFAIESPWPPPLVLMGGLGVVVDFKL